MTHVIGGGQIVSDRMYEIVVKGEVPVGADDETAKSWIIASLSFTAGFGMTVRTVDIEIRSRTDGAGPRGSQRHN